MGALPPLEKFEFRLPRLDEIILSAVHSQTIPVSSPPDISG